MSNRYAFLVCILITGLLAPVLSAQDGPSFAEKLGWGPTDKVVIFHVDDVGMSRDSNLGTIKAMEEGLANSCSIMMPCSWVSEYFHYLQKNPDVDSGLHLTLTSEWSEYRWGPLVGKPAAPGLVDKEGCMYGSVKDVVANATADEVEAEIRAQIDRARTMGFEITHLDSHMGTVFEPKFIERYIKVGIEEQIPIMFPAGHLQFIQQEDGISAQMVEIIRGLGKQVWAGGLPVLDDLHNVSYGWKREEKVEKFIGAMKEMRPGLTQVIIHATEVTCTFPFISTSGESRQGDMEAMLDPRLKQVVEEEGIILTTYRELMKRRQAVQE